VTDVEDTLRWCVELVAFEDLGCGSAVVSEEGFDQLLSIRCSSKRQNTVEVANNAGLL
jgi:hypothetical protein